MDKPCKLQLHIVWGSADVCKQHYTVDVCKQHYTVDVCKQHYTVDGCKQTAVEIDLCVVIFYYILCK